jgi:hypothetical protein
MCHAIGRFLHDTFFDVLCEFWLNHCHFPIAPEMIRTRHLYGRDKRGFPVKSQTKTSQQLQLRSRPAKGLRFKQEIAVEKPLLDHAGEGT